MPRVLVTGATGFLGRHLVRHLLALGSEVNVLHRDSPSGRNPTLVELERAGAEVVTFSNHDEVRAIVADLAPDSTFHLATRYLRNHEGADIDQLLEANVAFGAQLLEGLVGSGGVVVSTMSFFQYRNNLSTAYSLYSATKQAFSDISRYYREVRGLDIREVILYDTFGPGDTRDKLVPRLFEAAAEGTHLSMGPEAQELNLLFVEDVVAGLVAATDPNCEATVTLRAHSNVTVGQVVHEIESLAGHSLDGIFNNAAGVNDLVTESGHWNSPPGWEAKITLRDALEATYGWHRAQRPPKA